MLTLETLLRDAHLPTLTPRLAKRLEESLSLTTIRDLLFHLPLRYTERGTILPIRTFVAGGVEGTVIGTVTRLRAGKTMRRKLSFAEATVTDPSGTLQVLWFNQPWMTERLRLGDHIALTGKCSFSGGKPYLANPRYEILARAGESNHRRNMSLDHPLLSQSDLAVIPLYPETEGVTSRWLHYLIREALNRLTELPDEIPEAVREREHLSDLTSLLARIHFPKTSAEGEEAKRELLLRELFILQCAVLLARAHRETEKAIAVPLNAEMIKRFVEELPYRLTDAQRIAAYEILRDLERPRPMHRILVGDVGSGKTIIAAIAALSVVRSGKGQVAMMAPTEILAKQHFETLAKLLTHHRVRIGLLTGSESLVTPKRISSEAAIAISKPKLFREVENGEIDVLIGTHALISKPSRAKPNRLKPQGPLTFKRLMLAIIDEQHRFGVNQRRRMEEAASLGIAQGKGLDKPQKDMRSSPHLLSITATPIPRTLALTIFGDLDISTIGELPAGRQPVTTIVLPPERESLAFDTIRREVRAGHQAFIICPLVSTSEKIEAKAATEEFERLRRDVFPDLSIGLVHGQLKSREKEHTMREFARGRIDILVATPVIEVGIDIPNATVIVIEGAERFGLAQLYQFRGRVGRSTFPSFCFLVGGSKSATAKRRLAVIAKATSGKEIAAADLTLRGPGELLGERQSGIPDTFMRAIENLDLIERAREAARAFLTKGGLHSDPLLRRRIAAIRSQLHLS